MNIGISKNLDKLLFLLQEYQKQNEGFYVETSG